jgi:hypothetical protein
VTYCGFESLAVVGCSGLLLALSAPAGPVTDVLGVVVGGRDETGEQGADFVAGHRDQRVVAVVGLLPLRPR